MPPIEHGPQDRSQPDWSKYTSETIQLFMNPLRANDYYSRHNGLYDDERYKKWKSKSEAYIPPRLRDTDPKDLVLRALILQRHLPWVAATKPFTLEMGDPDANGVPTNDFIGVEEKHVNAVRFAYQQTTLLKPIFTKLYEENGGIYLDEDGVHNVDNTDFANLWVMDGPNRVEWLIDTLMVKARRSSNLISELATQTGLDGEQEATEFMEDIEDILGSFRK